MAMLFQNAVDLRRSLERVLRVEGNDLVLVDIEDLRERAIDRMVYNALFHESEELRYYLCWLIREAAARLEIFPASIQGLYEAAGSGGTPSFTTPSVNLRALTYDAARACFRAAQDAQSSAFLFDLADDGTGATALTPLEYATCILAAAIKEGHRGPVFLQAGHIHVDRGNYQADRADETGRLRDLIQEAITAGFFNIDLDTTALVDYALPTFTEQQAPSFRCCAELAAFIRENEPMELVTAIGAEIGEVCGKNRNVNELRAFLNGFDTELQTRRADAQGLAKIAWLTGTTRPVPNQAETQPEEILDFDILRDLGEVAQREYGVRLAVRGGLSPIPEECFDRFPSNNVGEIHLGNRIDDAIHEHEAFPAALREEMRRWTDSGYAVSRRPGETDEQFFYRGRVKAFGAFKQRLWDLPRELRDRIMADVETTFGLYLGKLNARTTAGLVRDAVDVEEIKLPAPVSGDHHTAEATWNVILDRLGPRRAPSLPAG